MVLIEHDHAGRVEHQKKQFIRYNIVNDNK